jgi:putative ABC transport system permease protein
MTGLLLAGADPATAVTAQLAIMYLILGSVAVSVAIVTLFALRGLLTDDLRVAKTTE